MKITRPMIYFLQCTPTFKMAVLTCRDSNYKKCFGLRCKDVFAQQNNLIGKKCGSRIILESDRDSRNRIGKCLKMPTPIATLYSLSNKLISHIIGNRNHDWWFHDTSILFKKNKTQPYNIPKTKFELPWLFCFLRKTIYYTIYSIFYMTAGWSCCRVVMLHTPFLILCGFIACNFCSDRLTTLTPPSINQSCHGYTPLTCISAILTNTHNVFAHTCSQQHNPPPPPHLSVCLDDSLYTISLYLVETLMAEK